MKEKVSMSNIGLIVFQRRNLAKINLSKRNKKTQKRPCDESFSHPSNFPDSHLFRRSRHDYLVMMMDSCEECCSTDEARRQMDSVVVMSSRC